MNFKKNLHNQQEGFSAIELLVSLFVAAILVTGFYQLFNVIDQGNLAARNNAIANNIALSNLSKYSSKEELTSLPSCTSSSTPLNKTEPHEVLPGSVTEIVTLGYAFSSSPCPDLDVNPIKITSTVKYGPPSSPTEVKQVTYVKKED